MLRPGNVHSAHNWREVLDPIVARYGRTGVRRYFRADAAFAKPEVYEYLEERRVLYAIRLPVLPSPLVLDRRSRRSPAATIRRAIPMRPLWPEKSSPRPAARAAARIRLASVSPVRPKTGVAGSAPADWIPRRARAVVSVSATVAGSG